MMTIAWVNVASLVVSTAMTVVLYVLSVQPMRLEKRMGAPAWKTCARLRAVSMVFMFIGLGNYVVYYFYPLPVLPQWLPCPYWLSVVAAVVIAIPSSYLMVRGMLDAGEEAAVPKKEHGMYSGIYEHVRHPQAWEVAYWFVLALMLHSPFLLAFSVLWLPLEYVMIMAEEPDLVLRFGQAYKDYQERTPAFVPRFWEKK